MIQAGRAASLFATAMLAAMTFPPLRLSASDCNGNSIEDSLELSGPFFTPQTLGGFPTSLLAAAVPLDGDRHVDLVVLSLGNGDGTWLHLLRSDGEGGFVPSDERRTMRNGWFFLAEDMDMDGDKDLVLLNGDSTLSLRRNDGSGSFSVEEETGIVIAPPSSLIAADFRTEILISRREDSILPPGP